MHYTMNHATILMSGGQADYKLCPLLFFKYSNLIEISCHSLSSSPEVKKFLCNPSEFGLTEWKDFKLHTLSTFYFKIIVGCISICVIPTRLTTNYFWKVKKYIWSFNLQTGWIWQSTIRNFYNPIIMLSNVDRMTPFPSWTSQFYPHHAVFFTLNLH
jgi:hypothetical protein